VLDLVFLIHYLMESIDKFHAMVCGDLLRCLVAADDFSVQEVGYREGIGFL
jgi:hypothetical protein